MHASAASIISERTAKGIRMVTLNRPKALNALNHHMVKELYPQYKTWEHSDEDKVIVLKGSGEKAFCAGGDIRSIYDAGGIVTRHSHSHPPHHSHNASHPTHNYYKDYKEHKKDHDDKHHRAHENHFFYDEYLLNYRISQLQTPHISLISGITMGGGMGLSVHGKYRVATNTSLCAMPETGIGFFCDVGGSYFLPRLKSSPEGPAYSAVDSSTPSNSHLGLYLALTGARLKGIDVFASGIATHFVPKERWEEFERDLLHNGKAEEIEQVLDHYHSEVDLPSNTIPWDFINKHFSQSSLFDIIKSLDSDSSEEAQSTLSTLRSHSPSALRVVFKQIENGRKLHNLAAALQMENRLAIHFMKRKDFFEGVRALLVDKDKNPKWDPATIEQVTDADVDSYFANVHEDEIHLVP